MGYIRVEPQPGGRFIVYPQGERVAVVTAGGEEEEQSSSLSVTSSNDKVTTTTPTPPPPQLSPPDDDLWDVYVSHVDYDGNIFIRFIGEEYSDAFQDLSVEMDEFYQAPARGQIGKSTK